MDIMSLKCEEIGRDRRICNLDGAWLKRQHSRFMRRWASRDPEGAPTVRYYKGWAA